MTGQSRMRAGLIAAASLGVIGAGYVGIRAVGSKPAATMPATQSAAKLSDKSSMSELTLGLARGDGMALAVLKQRLDPKPHEKPLPLSEAQSAEWVAALSGIRAGFAKFSAYGRASAVVVTAQVLHRYQVAPAPENWRDTLHPSCDILGSALADPVWEVRTAAVSEVKDLWVWSPARDLFTADLTLLGDWKQAFHPLILRRLGDREAQSRTAAVACLGALSLNTGAEPATQLLHDPDALVRAQVLMSFSERPVVLSEEAILPMLHDGDAAVKTIAKKVLIGRGLSEDQIGLGSLVANPRPDMRVSAIPFLKDRTDIDPILWLVYLTRDVEEYVRSKALEALASRTAPEARARVAEMAASDTSPAIRKQAGAILNPITTAELPPLPGPSQSLNIKAN